MNSVVLIGRLTRDPELNYNQNQMPICRVTLAVDRPRRQNAEQAADFIRVTVFDKQAENCSRYLSKGRQVAVHGRIQTGSYKNRDGQTVYTTDVVADRVEFLGAGQSDNSRYDGRSDNSNTNYRPASSDAQNANNWDMPSSFSTVSEDVPWEQ